MRSGLALCPHLTPTLKRLIIAGVLALSIAAGAVVAAHGASCTPIRTGAVVTNVARYPRLRWTAQRYQVSVRTYAGYAGAFVTYRRYSVGQQVTVRARVTRYGELFQVRP